MITLAPYRHSDGVALSRTLHPVSRAELPWPVECLPEWLDETADKGHAMTGLCGPAVVFVAISAEPEVPGGPRRTTFLFAEGHDDVMGFALRKWARAERRKFPGAEFVTVSLGPHPMKERFLAVAGCRRVVYGVFLS